MIAHLLSAAANFRAIAALSIASDTAAGWIAIAEQLEAQAWGVQ